VNYQDLDAGIKAPKRYRLSDVQDKIKKVAFDVVRFIEKDNIDTLWQVQSGPDGDYIVAMYPDDGPAVKEASGWEAVTDKSGHINLFYKGTPVTRINTASIAPDMDAEDVCKFLPNKLATNNKLLNSLMKDLSTSERHDLIIRFPELNK